MQEDYETLMVPFSALLNGTERPIQSFGEDAVKVCPQTCDVLKTTTVTDMHVAQAALAHMKSAAQLREDLLARVYGQSYQFFEKLVIDLLLAMGYAGGKPESIRHLGQSHDGGIDGVIQQDELGLDIILLQAKRLKPGHCVSSAQVREFVGSMEAKHSRKGIFFTSGHFTTAAQKFLRIVPHRVILIDGKELADLMISHNIGIQDEVRFVFKRVAESYFSTSRSK
jgi:restriction system protein